VSENIENQWKLQALERARRAFLAYPIFDVTEALAAAEELRTVGLDREADSVERAVDRILAAVPS
jgi:hypothetical protein